MIAQEWDEFMRWNDAIAEVCYPEVEYPEPAYLDLDDDVQLAIATELGVQDQDFGQCLGAVVRAVLTIGRGPERVFKEVLRERWAWHQAGNSGPPPVLPLLALLSLAAEQMGTSDGLRESNYYGRLVDLLGAVKSRDEIATAYRDSAELLWGSLNDWLTGLDGRHGTATARQVGPHRYVGIPISQALIRRAERQRILRFFHDSGLPVGAQVAEAELARLFTFWIEGEPSPSQGLARLWASDAHRVRVLEALNAALEQWDGRAEESRAVGDARGRIKLTLSISSFPMRTLSMMPLVYLDRASEPRRGCLLSACGAMEVDLVPVIPGALAVGEGIDNRHLLESVLEIDDPLTGERAQRLPGRFVVFRKDERNASWVETEGVVMGEELRLACRADLFPALETVLTSSGRPGWREVHVDTDGMPAGWRILLDVQIFAELAERLPPRSEELLRLHPIVTTQLLLAGGLKLPRIKDGWHRDGLPEVRALAPTRPGFTVRLFDGEGAAAGLLDEWVDAGCGQLVVDLAGRELDSGSYRVELVLAGDDSAAAMRAFRVHDGDAPVEGETIELVHDLDDALTVLGVFRNRDVDTVNWHEGGETAPSNLGLFDVGLPPIHPTWSGELRPAKLDWKPIELHPLDHDSCVFTGAHHWNLDQVDVDGTGRVLRAEGQGRCIHCGLEQVYCNSYWRNRRNHLRHQSQKVQSPRLGVLRPSVPSVRALSDPMPWDTLIDALATLGGGPWAEFLALMRQVEASGPAVFHVAHTLEALGYVEIEREADTLEPTNWTVTRPALVEDARGLRCVGRWTRRSRESAAIAMSAGLTRRRNEGPDIWLLTHAAGPAPVGIPLAGPSWEPLADRLPMISAVIAALPRRSLQRTGNFQWFHVPSACWVSVDSPIQVGAYRLRSFSTTDLFRSAEDLANGSIAMSQVRFGKHAAAYVTGGKPLMAFDPATARMTVPLGADLPGLYNRAVVLAAGRLPHKEGRTLVYDNVPTDLASHLYYLLGH